jgi:demethylmenaquinone methyltransferase/2-methoxy-6-polyprenyl-1,4-benzoquinol methylase
MKSSQDFSRVNRPVKNAEQYYSKLSKVYDWLASSEKRFIRLGLGLLHPEPGERILEIGFGTGYAQQHIVQAVENGLSVGLDLSAGMGRVAQKRLSDAGIKNSIELLQSDTLPIPFQESVFDGVFSSFTLELFDSPLIPTVLNECQRVLKPGGRLVVVSLSKDQPLGLFGRLYESFHDHFPTLADCRPIPVRHLITDAGFIIQESLEYKMWGLPVGIVLASKTDLTGRG